MTPSLNVYVLVDTSGSMRGEGIESVNVGLRSLVSSLRQKPNANELISLSIVTFDSLISEVLPLTVLGKVQLPELQCPNSGATFLGECLEYIYGRICGDREKHDSNSTGNKTYLVVFSDGKASDTLAFEESLPKITSLNLTNIIACAAGPKSQPDQLKQLTPTVVSLDTMDSGTFSSFFIWVGDAVSGEKATQGLTGNLPPPPAQITVMF
jgi:uncharacterized protein YegL